MRPRTVLKILVAVLTILFIMLSILHVYKAHSDEVHEGVRAITYAIIALTCATGYRYFED